MNEPKFPVIVHLLSAVLAVFVAVSIAMITNPHSGYYIALIYIASVFVVPMIPVLIFLRRLS